MTKVQINEILDLNDEDRIDAFLSKITRLEKENQKLKEKLGFAKKTLGEIIDKTDNSCRDHEEATHIVYLIATKVFQQLKEWVN